MAAAAGAAFLWGGRPERIGAAAVLAAWVASLVLAQWSHHWFEAQWGILAVDAVLFGVLLWLALRADRFWPLWACAFQLLGVVTHLAILADRSLTGRAYFVAAVIWSYLVLIALGVGAWNCRRRRRFSPAA